MAVEGQIEGGTVQGYAWAMMEEMQYNENGNVNPGFVDYRVPTSADLPTVESVIVEVPAPNGPYGAKGVGEPRLSRRRWRQWQTLSKMLSAYGSMSYLSNLKRSLMP